MKHVRKVLTLMLSAVMMMALTVTAFAAVSTDSGKGGEGSITITLPKDNAGTDQEITYSLYKVFEATTDGTSISYKIDSANGDLSDDMIAAGFFLDDGGNVHYGTFTEDENGTYMVGGKKGTITDKTELDQAALDAIAAYATDKIGDFTAVPSDGTLKITGLEFGYYYITTTTGTAVTIDSTKKDAEVNDKNTIPNPPKKTIIEDFEGCVDEAGKNAIAQVGTDVPFSVEIVVEKGAVNYVFHDVMSTGLTYNNDVSVVPAESVASTETDTAAGDSLTVTFDNDWLAANEGVTITIEYSAKVNNDALTIDYVNNTATLDYGEGNTTEKDEVTLYTAKFTVSKEDGSGKALEGAGFVIKNEDGYYYTLTDDGVVWVESIDDADEHVSNSKGEVDPFTGLANGTYTLEEKTVPDGYNKAADYTFTIAEDDYTAANLEQEATVVNEAGSTLPSTGGIGTTIFYTIGTILVLGAGVILVSKRRMGTN